MKIKFYFIFSSFFFILSYINLCTNVPVDIPNSNYVSVLFCYVLLIFHFLQSHSTLKLWSTRFSIIFTPLHPHSSTPYIAMLSSKTSNTQAFLMKLFPKILWTVLHVIANSISVLTHILFYIVPFLSRFFL